MRVTLPIHVKRALQAQGWTSGIRLVEEGETSSTLEGTPSQFEHLYDDMNHLSLQIQRSAALVRMKLDEENRSTIGP